MQGMWCVSTCAAALLLAATSVANARPTGEGSLAGEVRGPGDVRLPGAVVRVFDGSGREVQRAVSNDLGLFRLARLAAGTYAIEAGLEGFVDQPSTPVEIQSGHTTTVTLRLRLASITEQVGVIGTAPRDSLEVAVIRESPARDVGEALATTAGISKVRKAAIANDVVLRGLQGADLNVLIDGHRLYGACPNSMDPPAFHVDFSEVARVDVAKGPFDMKNQGGLGGVVNIVTEQPRSGRHGMASVAAASDGYVNPSLTGSLGGDRISALAGYAYRQGGVYDDGSGQPFIAGANYRPGVDRMSAFAAHTAWSRLAWRAGEGKTVGASYTHQDAGRVLYPYLLMDALSDIADRASVSFEAADLAAGWTQLAVRAYYTSVSHWMTDQYRVSADNAFRGYSMGTDAATETIGSRGEAQWRGITAGGEAFHRRWDTETTMAGQRYVPQYPLANATITSAGLFGEHTRTLGAAGRLDIGARLDHVASRTDALPLNQALYRAYHREASTSHDDVLPAAKARVSWKGSSGLHLAGGLGFSSRAPDQLERYYALRRMGTDWVGNPGLDPTGNLGLDVELGMTRGAWHASANVFAYGVDDYIVVVNAPRLGVEPGVMNLQARSYDNVDALLRGVEIKAGGVFGTRVFLTGDLGVVRGTRRGPLDPSTASRDLAEMPPAQGRMAIRFDDGRFAVLAEGVFAARQSHVDTVLGESPTPGYGVANLRVSWRLGPIGLTGGVTNLFDRTYAEHLSYQRDPFRSGVRVNEPGRQLHVSAVTRF